VVLAGVLLTGIVASSALELTGGGAVAIADPVIIVSVQCVEDLGATAADDHLSAPHLPVLTGPQATFPDPSELVGAIWRRQGPPLKQLWAALTAVGLSPAEDKI